MSIVTHSYQATHPYEWVLSFIWSDLFIWNDSFIWSDSFIWMSHCIHLKRLIHMKHECMCVPKHVRYDSFTLWGTHIYSRVRHDSFADDSFTYEALTYTHTCAMTHSQMTRSLIPKSSSQNLGCRHIYRYSYVRLDLIKKVTWLVTNHLLSAPSQII